MNEQDLQKRRERLRHSLASLPEKALNREKAIGALEDWAALIQAGERPVDVGYDEAAALLRLATGKDLSSMQAPETVEIRPRSTSDLKALVEVPIFRGIGLKLTSSMELLSMDVSPAKIAEGRRLLSIVGIGFDTATDVSINHDEYLADAFDWRNR